MTNTKIVTRAKNEISTGLNNPRQFILAIVQVDGESGLPHYVISPLQKELDFGVTSVNYDLDDVLARAERPI